MTDRGPGRLDVLIPCVSRGACTEFPNLMGKKSKRFLFTRIIRRDNNTHVRPPGTVVLLYFSCFLVGVLNTTHRHSGEHSNWCCHVKASSTNEHNFLICKFDREKCTRFKYDANYYAKKTRLILLVS